MLELASLGAPRCMQTRSVMYGMKYNVSLRVRSSFSDDPGTLIVEEDSAMEDVLVAGVALNKDEAKVTIRGVPDRPGMAARIFAPLAAAGVVVDMIIQNISAEGHTDMTFTVPKGDVREGAGDSRAVLKEFGGREISSDTGLAKVSIVGSGMRSHAGVASRMFNVLAGAGINIQMISTSEIKVSCIIEAKYAELAVRLLHEEFGLGKGGEKAS